MRLELGYFAHGLISGLNDGTATLKWTYVYKGLKEYKEREKIQYLTLIEDTLHKAPMHKKERGKFIMYTFLTASTSG